MSNTTGIPIDPWWAPLEPCTLCRASKGGTGDDYANRMPNRAAALQACQRGINHLAGTTVRLVFCTSHAYAYKPAALGAGQTDIYKYRYRDYIDNERSRTVRVMHQLREADPNAVTRAYAQALDSSLALAEAGPKYDGIVASAADYRPVGPDAWPISRDSDTSPADAEQNAGLAVFNNYCPLAVSIQGNPPALLDAGWGVAPSPPLTGADLLAGYLEKIRAAFHELRTTYERNVLMWYACQKNAGWDTSMTADSGNQYGIHITSTSLINVLDFTSTSRTATTPGWSSHVYACGRGHSSTTHGQQLKVTLRVLASATTADGTVRFIGPDSFASNSADITITNGVAVAWYGSGSDYIYLDTTSSNLDETTARNKIDVHGKAGESGALFIYALQAIAVWS